MEFFQHLNTYLSNKEVELLKSSLQETQKYGLLLNEKKMSKQQFIKEFPHVIPHPIVPNGFIYDKNEYEFGKHVYHEMGVYYLQEPSAMIVSYLLKPNPGEIVLDLCAAPGGKTTQASLLMDNEGVLISNDLSHQRCQVLLENVERMGLSNVLIVNNDFEKIYKNYFEYFDKIILDAPCSGSGMFRKDDKMLVDWSYAKVLKFADIQKHLIQIAFEMLKPGGELIYSTCSLSKEEDEDVVKELLSNNPNASLLDIKNDLFYVNKKEPIGVHLLSFKFEGEGHYIAKIKKNGEIIAKSSKIKSSKMNPLKTSFNEFTFSLPIDVKIKGLNVVRHGLKMYEKKGKDLIYSHHLSHSELARAHNAGTCELSLIEAEKYVKGEVLNIKTDKGFILLTYHKIPLGYGKSDGRVIKNHYPKYLRNKKLIF